MEYAIALVALTSMEIVLGIDNIVFIAILTSRLRAEQQDIARRVGLGLAMLMRIGLLLTLTVILRLTNPIFHLQGLLDVFGGGFSLPEEIDAVSVKDLILFTGGLFLIWKSVLEIHKKLEDSEEKKDVSQHAEFYGVLTQIVIMDIIFSLDSVITAVGMVKADKTGIWIMVASIVIAVGVMMIFAGPVSRFVERNPTLKMLALSFLILIGVMLVAEGIGTHFDKGYIYFAMTFALIVEMLNLRIRGRKHAAAKEPA